MLELIITLNLGQQIFLVVFSILYGVLLQSLPKGLFPLASSLRGKTFRSGRVTTFYQNMWFNRVCLSIIIFNFLPAVYLFKMLFVLSIVPNHFNVIHQFIYLLFIFWSSLGVFGFYRIFYIVVIKWRTLFKDMIDEFDDRALSYDSWSHLCWVIFYFFPSIILFVRFISDYCAQAIS